MSLRNYATSLTPTGTTTHSRARTDTNTAQTGLVRIHGDLMHAVDSRHRVLLVLLDLSAAFDTLNHSPLYSISMLPIADIFDRHQIRYHIYADDTQLYAECPPSNHTDAQRKIDECVNDIRRWLDDNHLFLNEANTEAILSRSSVVHSPSPLPSIYVCGLPISLSPTVRDIGVLLDSRLDMSAQVSNVCRGAYSKRFIYYCENTNESQNCSVLERSSTLQF